jgi:hypothetical protein
MKPSCGSGWLLSDTAKHTGDTEKRSNNGFYGSQEYVGDGQLRVGDKSAIALTARQRWLQKSGYARFRSGRVDASRVVAMVLLRFFRQWESANIN